MRLDERLAATHVLRRSGAVTMLVRRDWLGALPVDAMLAGAPLERWGEPVEHDLAGRDRIHVLRTPRGEVVAKQHTRGGVIGALFRRLFVGARRPWREAAVAEELIEAGCPTPPVVAVRATRRWGPLHTLELATRREVGARDLLEVLVAAADEGRRERGLARAAGETLAELHALGLRHRDLQVKNLLVPAGFPGPRGPRAPTRLVVLDLDRCRLGAPLDAGAREVALARLARSLVKHRLLGAPGAPLDRSDVLEFARGYALGGRPSGPVIRGAARRSRRSVRARRWLWRRRSGPTTD